MYLVQERDARRAREREQVRLSVRARLHEALGSLCPGRAVFVFGSITRAGKFYRQSDIDLALEQLPEGLSHYALIGLLEEGMGRSIDLLLLGETRLREKILAEAERWTV